MASLPIVAGDRVHFVGDSLTAFGWPLPSGGFVSQVNATWSPPAPAPIYAAAAGGTVVITGPSAVVGNSQQPAKAIAATTSGVAGNKAADIAADVANRILAFNPTKVVLEVGVNDAIQATDPTAFAASYLSIITQTRAALPGIPFLCIGILCDGEFWNAGPAWGGNGSDTAIATIGASIQSIAASTGSIYVDLRSPLIAYEGIHNVPGPPGTFMGTVTADGLHPINPAGQVLMGSWVLPYVSVSP